MEQQTQMIHSKTLDIATSGKPVEGKIYAAMNLLMSKVGAIGKDHKNDSQKFNFRGIDDVYNEVNSALTEAKIFTVPQCISRYVEQVPVGQGKTWSHVHMEMVYRFTSCEDGSFVTVGPVWGEGRDSGDKGSNKAESIAHKYAILQVLCIPTKEEDKDPDKGSPPERVTNNRAQSSKAPRTGPAAKDLNALFATSKAAGWTVDDLKTYLMESYGIETSKELTPAQFTELRKHIMAGGKPVARKKVLTPSDELPADPRHPDEPGDAQE